MLHPQPSLAAQVTACRPLPDLQNSNLAHVLDVTTLVALIAVMLTASGIVSVLIERAPLSFPIIFLGLGFLFGSTGVIKLSPHSQALEAAGFLVLALGLQRPSMAELLVLLSCLIDQLQSRRRCNY